jgi:hypothetical protein
VDAPAGARRVFGDCFQQGGRAPLHAGGPELHIDHRAGNRAGDFLGQIDVIARPHGRPHERFVDHATHIIRQGPEYVGAVTVNNRILVAHGKREC